MVREQTLIPSASSIRDVLIVLAGATLTALAAQVTISVEPVPFTLQTFAVMLCGLGLGARRAVAAQATYLIAGAAGAPVFAGFSGGAGPIVGKTGGYLISFVVVAGFLGWCADSGWDRNLWSCAGSLAVAVAINLLLGAAWLSIWIGLPSALTMGVLPFLFIEMVKAAVASVSLPSLRKIC